MTTLPLTVPEPHDAAARYLSATESDEQGSARVPGWVQGVSVQLRAVTR